MYLPKEILDLIFSFTDVNTCLINGMIHLIYHFTTHQINMELINLGDQYLFFKLFNLVQYESGFVYGLYALEKRQLHFFYHILHAMIEKRLNTIHDICAEIASRALLQKKYFIIQILHQQKNLQLLSLLQEWYFKFIMREEYYQAQILEDINGSILYKEGHLVRASYLGKLGAVKFFLNQFHNSPHVKIWILKLATQMSHLHIVKWLVVNYPNNLNFILTQAIRTTNLEMIKYAVNELKLKPTTQDLQTSLFTRNAEIVRLVFKARNE